MITVKEPRSLEEIDSIIKDNDIYESISDDRCPPKEDFKMPYEDFKFLGVYLKKKIIGLMIIEDDNRVHYQVLPEHRKECADEGARKCLLLLQRPIFAEIPTLYPNVVGFVKKHGFKKFKKIDRTLLKGGQSYDINQYILK